MELYCRGCGNGERFEATALIESVIYTDGNGFPAEDYDDHPTFREDISEGAALYYECPFCEVRLSPAVSGSERKERIESLERARERLAAEIERVEVESEWQVAGL